MTAAAEVPETGLTQEELALVADGLVESLSDDGARRLAEWLRDDPRLGDPFAQLEALASETGMRREGSREYLSAAVATDEALGRLLAAEGWRHPAEVLDPDGWAGVPYPSLIALAKAREEKAGDPARLRAVRQRLEEAAAAEEAEDQLIEKLRDKLRELPPGRAARVLAQVAREVGRERGGVAESGRRRAVGSE